MAKAMTILYPYHTGLYVNLTNACPCACTFCLRTHKDHVEGSEPLWLEHEPSFEEVIQAFDGFDLSAYKEIVFCGYGEPTERLDLLLEVADWIKAHSDLPIRINTNGLANLIHQKDITPLLKGRIDALSISLNTPDPKKYNELVRPRFGMQSFDAMLDFTKKASQYVPNVMMTTVETTLSKEEEELCKKICDDVHATYRIRPWVD
jgi:radical SAM enzyme (TIGR04100 family)